MQVSTVWTKSPTERSERHTRLRRALALALLLLLLIVSVVLVAWWFLRLHVEDGSRIVSAGDLQVSEALAQIDGEADKNRITVSLAPSLEWDPSAESLKVHFIVVPGNNGYSERFEIEQDGRVIYASEVVDPDNSVEQVRVPEAHEGAAVVTVYAVDSSGTDRGNPVSVESEIIRADS